MKLFSVNATKPAAAFLSATAIGLMALTSGASAQNSIGLGVGFIPKYEGSEDYRALPVPIINYHNGNFFISPRAGLPSLGLKADLTDNWSAGVFLGMHLGRDSDDSNRLTGMDDIDFHGAAGVFTEWRPGPFSIGAAYYQALHSGYGGVLELRGSYQAWKSATDSLRFGVSTQWANDDSMKTHFGVTRREAAASRGRLNAYSPSSGFKSVSAFGLWTHHLGGSWNLNTVLGVSSLVGDAADSPIVQDKVSVFGNVGVTYSF